MWSFQRDKSVLVGPGGQMTVPEHDEVVRQVIRYRFLDPEASADVIAQKLRQQGWPIAARSVQRVIEEYGLQKKTLQEPPVRRAD